MTLMGEVVYERAYYHCKHCHCKHCHCKHCHCKHCHNGFFPTDEEFRIPEKKTPATCEVATLAGVLHPFDEAAREVLPKLCGINLSASSVQKVIEAAGDHLA